MPDRLSMFNYAHLPERFKTQRRIDAAELPAPDVKLRILQRTIARLLRRAMSISAWIISPARKTSSPRPAAKALCIAISRAIRPTPTAT
jgi:coproporphyrinogen III oxidase-like Fe-S oxidoreductase